MKRETIDQLCADFERLVKVEQDTGLEFWTARDLQTVLGYDRWENFANAIERAKTACTTAGYEAQDHFLEATKMIELGKGAQEHVKNNIDVRKVLTDRGIVPEQLPPAEDAKKVERRLASEAKKLPNRNDD